MFVNRINIIIDTPNDISKYLELKSVNPPSTIPIPPGINDKTPNIIEVAQVGMTLRNSKFSIPNDNSTKYTTTASINQKIIDSVEAQKAIGPLVDFLIVSYDDDNGSANFEVNFLFPKIAISLLKTFLDEITIKAKINKAVKNPII